MPRKVMKESTIHVHVAGYPDIELTIPLPIDEPTKIRKEGITFHIRPTETKGTYLLDASKGQLRISSIILKVKL